MNISLLPHAARRLARTIVFPADAASPPAARHSCWGLLSRRERWGITLRGCLAAAGVAGLGLFFVGATVHEFLAVTAREATDVLVVEGWVDDAVIRAASREFIMGSYAVAFTTGGAAGRTTNPAAAPAPSVANVGAQRLRAAGVPHHRVLAAPAGASVRDRTYASAVALRDLLHAKALTPTRVNLLTEGTHARRTRLLFQAAFGDRVKIGIIAVPSANYDPDRWWHSSEGVREVLGESIAYVYAKFFFFPPAALAVPSRQPVIRPST
jgi:uncharacterized SAM-binding protein YcdF (DUF218 family)